MKKTEYTKGPWVVDPLVAQVNALQDGEPICKMLWPTNNRSEEETRANADLIAMIPTLMELLPEMIAALRACSQWTQRAYELEVSGSMKAAQDRSLRRANQVLATAEKEGLEDFA